MVFCLLFIAGLVCKCFVCKSIRGRKRRQHRADAAESDAAGGPVSYPMVPQDPYAPTMHPGSQQARFVQGNQNSGLSAAPSGSRRGAATAVPTTDIRMPDPPLPTYSDAKYYESEDKKVVPA